MYGKEGKRKSYPAYSCSKILNNNAPNSNEHHGCPYKHGTVQEVTALLNQLGVDPTKQKAVLAQMQSHNYQLACVEHFKAAHPGVMPSDGGFGNHPNAWFQASVKATAAISLPSSSSASPSQSVAPTTKNALTPTGENDVDMLDEFSGPSLVSAVSPEK